MATVSTTPETAGGQRTTDPMDRPKPNGPAFAALLAAGIGSTALGLFTTLAAASKPFSDALVLNKAVGPLSGKTTYAVALFFISWAILAFVMRGKMYRERPMFLAITVLIGLGVLGTFPLFFELFH